MSARRRIAAVALRSPAVWLVLPVVLGLDVMVALSRGAGWRGELSSLTESVAPVVMLFSPLLAGLGAWLARQDRALDVSGLLRSCAEGRRQIVVRVVVAAGLPAALHLLVLSALAVVSLKTARVGGWPAGPLLVQLAAFPAFTALGYAVGWFVDHVVAPLLAAGVALLAAYTDYGNPRWPLGFISDGGSGSFIGRHPDGLAILARLTFCAGLTGLAVLATSWAFAATRTRWAQVAACAVLFVSGVRLVQTHAEIWTEQTPTPVADYCVGARPRICVLPDYAGLAPRTARIADRAAALLRSSGASGLPDTFVGWIPSMRQPENVVTVIDPETAYQPATAVDIVSDVVAPKSCVQWFSGLDLDRAGAAEQIVLTWLAEQDPGLVARAHVPSYGADVQGFLNRPRDQQRVRIATVATALATCDFASLPAPGSPM